MPTESRRSKVWLRLLTSLLPFLALLESTHITHNLLAGATPIATLRFIPSELVINVSATLLTIIVTSLLPYSWLDIRLKALTDYIAFVLAAAVLPICKIYYLSLDHFAMLPARDPLRFCMSILADLAIIGAAFLLSFWFEVVMYSARRNGVSLCGPGSYYHALWDLRKTIPGSRLRSLDVLYEQEYDVMVSSDSLPLASKSSQEL